MFGSVTAIYAPFTMIEDMGNYSTFTPTSIDLPTPKGPVSSSFRPIRPTESKLFTRRILSTLPSRPAFGDAALTRNKGRIGKAPRWDLYRVLEDQRADWIHQAAQAKPGDLFVSVDLVKSDRFDESCENAERHLALNSQARKETALTDNSLKIETANILERRPVHTTTPANFYHCLREPAGRVEGFDAVYSSTKIPQP
jgi:hypothetical protein